MQVCLKRLMSVVAPIKSSIINHQNNISKVYIKFGHEAKNHQLLVSKSCYSLPTNSRRRRESTMMLKNKSLLCLVLNVMMGLLSTTRSSAFLISPYSVTTGRVVVKGRDWRMSTTGDEPMILNDDDEEEEVEPGKMRVSEIKAELELRGVNFKDCFDKESLSQRLEEARASGKANPEILDRFNKQRLEQTFKDEKVEINDTHIDSAVANDGSLLGGMDPEVFKKLMGNPEVMAILQSTQMQEAMKIMMTGGQEELEEALKKDPELVETLKKLDEIMKSAQ